MKYKSISILLATITASICALFGVHDTLVSKDLEYQDTKKEKLIKKLQDDGYDYYTACKKATELLDDHSKSLKKYLDSAGTPTFNDLTNNNLITIETNAE